MVSKDKNKKMKKTKKNNSINDILMGNTTEDLYIENNYKGDIIDDNSIKEENENEMEDSNACR